MPRWFLWHQSTKSWFSAGDETNDSRVSGDLLSLHRLVGRIVVGPSLGSAGVWVGMGKVIRTTVHSWSKMYHEPLTLKPF